MAKRREKKADAKPSEPIRFAPLDGSNWEDSGYLPPDDQSWREMEALRIAAYDRIGGHLPPDDDHSWREREALRLAAEPDTGDANDANEASRGNEAEDAAREVPEPDWALDEDLGPPETLLEQELRLERELGLDQESGPERAPDPGGEPRFEQAPTLEREPVPEFPPVRRGAGGVMLLLVSAVGLVTVALAVPNILTPDFWRTQWAAARSLAQPAATPEQRVASIPAPPPAVRPAILPPPPQPAPDNGPASDAQPPTNSAPPANAESDANAEPSANAGLAANTGPAANVGDPPAEATENATPEVTPSPRPDISAKRGAMVISPEGKVKYENAPAAGSREARRAPRREDSEDRGVGGFYAKAPGPDGVLRYKYFPTRPPTDSREAARAPSRDDNNSDPGGVYAMAPGPDGKLEYQYFPDRAR